MLGLVACRISCLAGYLILLVFPVRRYKESAAAEIERDRRVVGHAAALGDAYATLTRGESGLPQPGEAEHTRDCIRKHGNVTGSLVWHRFLMFDIRGC